MGYGDSELHKDGLAQCEALSAYFSGKKISVVIHSGSKQAARTAEIIAGNRIPVVADTGFAELNPGDWNGKSFDEIKITFPEQYETMIKNTPCFSPPNGESLRSCCNRMLGAFFSAANAEKTQNMVIVSHFHALRCLVSALYFSDIGRISAINQDNCCVNVVEKIGSEFIVKSINKIVYC